MANQITVFLDQALMPAQGQPQATLDANVAQFFSNLPTFGAQFNAGVANLNASLNGAGISIPYTIDLSSTADADPGAGKLRFSSATQNAATVLRLDLLSSNTGDYTAVLDTFDASTSTIKGRIALVKQGDAKTFLMFDVTARSTPTGYRNITVTPVASSSANPFVSGDAVLLYFDRNGDRAVGSGFTNLVVISGTQTWQPPAGITQAEITIIDGGQSGGTQLSGGGTGGNGGNASISVRAVNPSTVYTATVGAGGIAGGASTSVVPSAGGASSFSGSGLTTLTSASGDLKVPGGGALAIGVNGTGGQSLYCPVSVAVPTGYGGGGAGVNNGQAGINGKAGAIIIRY